MKNAKYLILAGIILLGLAACNAANPQAKSNLEELYEIEANCKHMNLYETCFEMTLSLNYKTAEYSLWYFGYLVNPDGSFTLQLMKTMDKTNEHSIMEYTFTFDGSRYICTEKEVPNIFGEDEVERAWKYASDRHLVKEYVPNKVKVKYDKDKEGALEFVSVMPRCLCHMALGIKLMDGDTCIWADSSGRISTDLFPIILDHDKDGIDELMLFYSKAHENHSIIIYKKGWS